MEDIFAKLMAHKLGREPTPEELEENRRIQEEAINLSSGVLGSVGNVSKFGKITDALNKSAAKEIVEPAAERLTPEQIAKFKEIANTPFNKQELLDKLKMNFKK